MASYPINYDSSGEILSIEFHDHKENARHLPHTDLNFPIPYGVTVKWKSGRQDSVVNLSILGIGKARVVLRGIDVASNKFYPYVFKLQGWKYHDRSYQLT